MNNRILLTPYFLDQPSAGVEHLAQPGWQRNTALPMGQDQIARLASVHQELCTLVADVATRGDRPVSVAGDCCAAIPVLGGLQRAGIDPVLLWLDAHGDFNTASTTISGFLGGMPLAMMTGRGDQALMGATGTRPLPDADVVLSDARDLDPAEGDLLRDSGVRQVDSPRLVPGALPPHRPVYVHLDCDVLDPGSAPAMRYSVPGGPALAELVGLGNALHRSGRICAVSVTAWDVEADADGRTGRACLSVLKAFLGRSDG